MNLYGAIMKAADQIERFPSSFNFMTIRFPDCGAPGCALGWIGAFLPVEARNLAPTWQRHNVGAISSGALGLAGGSAEFYDRMTILCGSHEWRNSAALCAKTLRQYADKYHASDRENDGEAFKRFLAAALKVEPETACAATRESL